MRFHQILGPKVKILVFQKSISFLRFSHPPLLLPLPPTTQIIRQISLPCPLTSARQSTPRAAGKKPLRLIMTTSFGAANSATSATAAALVSSHEAAKLQFHCFNGLKSTGTISPSSNSLLLSKRLSVLHSVTASSIIRAVSTVQTTHSQFSFLHSCVFPSKTKFVAFTSR